jgi:hypothetical protein
MQEIEHLMSMKKWDAEMRSGKVSSGAVRQATFIPIRTNVRRDVVITSME